MDRHRAASAFQTPYTDLVYEPMLELMRYPRSNQFKTYIVSGGGIELMRPWTEKMYSIPPEQVVIPSSPPGGYWTSVQLDQSYPFN